MAILGRARHKCPTHRRRRGLLRTWRPPNKNDKRAPEPPTTQPCRGSARLVWMRSPEPSGEPTLLESARQHPTWPPDSSANDVTPHTSPVPFWPLCRPGNGGMGERVAGVLAASRSTCEQTLFLLKLVAEVIDPVMGLLQPNSTELQLCTIEAENISRMNLLLLVYPSIGRFQTRHFGRQTFEKIVSWNYGLGVIFPQNSTYLIACEYCLDGQNEHVNIC